MTDPDAKVAVVTGAARGIGQAYARRLARDGMHVVAADLAAAEETKSQIEARGGSCHAVVCDLAREDSIAELATTVQSTYGRCDVLVNNAADQTQGGLLEMSYADWRAILSVNLDACFLTARAFAPGMCDRGWGRIVNQVSGAVSLPFPRTIGYTSSKMGLLGLTRSLASDLGPYGVTVNAIAPGLIRTPATTGAGNAPGGDHSREEAFAAAVQTQPIKRTGEPDDLAGVLSFLVSDDASFMTGQMLYVDGGWVRSS
jgi:NAD(P)-dependent dehydrogenase (short-subunit alcohol dehydrogenase family)